MAYSRNDEMVGNAWRGANSASCRSGFRRPIGANRECARSLLAQAIKGDLQVVIVIRSQDTQLQANFAGRRLRIS